MVENSFTDLEYKLYGRQMILPEVGTKGQEKLKNATVAAIGAGGLGAPALLYLAGAGVGRIIIIDDDRVETTNLHRQVIHTYSRVGNLKAESAAEALRALNPAITVETRLERLTDANADELLGEADVVIDGSDNFPTRYTASRACGRLGIPHVWGAILGFDAQMSVFWAGHGPVYEDLYPHEPAPGSVPNCATAGVIGALAGVVGTAMALETTKLIMDVGTPLIGKVGYYSGLEGTWDYIPLVAQKRKSIQRGEARPSAATAVQKAETPMPDNAADHREMSWEAYSRLEKTRPTLLLDVREEHEHAALAVPGSLFLPLSKIRILAQSGELATELEHLIPSDTETVGIYCAAGVRSLEALEHFEENGFEKGVSLTGGISEWLARK